MTDARRPTGMPPAGTVVLVWDIGIRLFHWSLVLAVTVALLTGLLLLPAWVTMHLVAGVAAVALVAARLVWGVVGPGTARFASFVHGPRDILAHLRDLLGRRVRRHLGHNPLGGAMIVVLLAAVVALAATGTIVLGGSLKSGPLAFATTYATGETVRGIHKILAWVLLGMIALHVAGALFESWRSRENLVRAMVNGHKARRPGDHSLPLATGRPMLAAAIVATVLLGGAGITYGMTRQPGLGVPTSSLDPVYAEECGACHIPYHPSLAPAATWSAIMSVLADHFGDDAELDDATAEHIRAYLLGNAAEAYDTKPANRMREVDPADPLRLTATPFWQRAHRGIPDDVFASAAVVSRGNCGACHGDATSGLYTPFAIDIPESASP